VGVVQNVDAQHHFISELKTSGFQYEELMNPVQLWDNQVIEMDNKNRTTIEKVTEENYLEAVEIECNIKEFGGKETIKKVFREQFNHPAFTHYLLRYDGIPCSTACVFEYNNYARLESVATCEEFRGRGFIGEIIQFIQKESTTRGIEQLWVLPINESIEKVYKKYGFQTVGKIKMGHAFLEGKSIKEIQR
jgi:GNAT superfamily N-acetyltransferase